MMRSWILPVFLLAALAGLSPIGAEQIGQDAAVCAGGKGPAIQIEVLGLKDRTGELWLELYPDNEADYLADDHALIAAGKTFRRTRAKLPGGGPVEMCIRVPAPGRYALLLRHNRTGKDKFSFWSDGVGIPANKNLVRHKPTLAESEITAGPGVTVAPIRLQYLNGFGFSPLG